MTLARLIVAVGSLLALTSSAHAWDPPANGVRDAWQALVDGGCDLAKAKVRTPFETYVLRHAMLAVHGQGVDDQNLALLFFADGGWYKLGQVTEPSAAEKACQKKLEAREAELLKTVKVDRRASG